MAFWPLSSLLWQIVSRPTVRDESHTHQFGDSVFIVSKVDEDGAGRGVLFFSRRETDDQRRTGPYRRAEYPDVPSAAEKGFAEEAAQWFGFFALVGVSDQDVETLNKMVSEIMRSEKGRQLIASQGVRFEDWTPAEFQAYMAKEFSSWEKLVAGGMR